MVRTADLSKYFVEEFLKASHGVVVLARGPREWFTRPDIFLRQTNYSVPSLLQHIHDCDGLVSAIQDPSMMNVDVHLALLEACKQSSKCKRFIPSKFIGDVEQFPAEPGFYAANHQPIRNALAAQHDVMWTLFNPGWLADYVVPQEHHYIRNIGPLHPVDFDTGTMVIPGTGDEPVTCTAVRDVARAVGWLFEVPQWEEVTYISGSDTTCNQFKDLLAAHGHKLKVSYCAKADIRHVVAHPEDYSEDELTTAQFGMWSALGSTRVPERKAEAQKEKFFKGLDFRSLEQLLREAESGAVVVV